MALALASCGVRDTIYNPSHYRPRAGAVAPPDVVLPEGARPGSLVNGLHVGSGDAKTEDLCCWIDVRTHIRVQKRAGQTTLRIGAYIPKDKPFTQTPQRLVVRFNGADAIAFPPMGPGSHVEAVHIPKAIVPLEGPITLTIIASERWTPRDLPTSRYAALLLSVLFE